MSVQNKLNGRESAYLKQHSDNPVNWWPWEDEAFKNAKEQNKPIFLSIGYSTCHWCHVMAHESFADQHTASILNKDFVSIKVDREEHPQVDQYFQKICAMATGQGGWPLSVFMDSEKNIISIGTYYPKEQKEQMPSFEQVLTSVIEASKNQQEQIKSQNIQIMQALKTGFPIQNKIEFEGEFPHPNAVLNAVDKLKDEEFGGYGDAPKFPNFAFYEWAIEQMLEGVVEKNFGDHIIRSIENMMLSGTYDQARGGFHRYATDAAWNVPHFEKMLYDQAGLLRLLSKTSLIYPSAVIFDSLIQTLDYLENEMLSEKGYFFSAQDADSEGVEGLYFTFTSDEFDEAIINHGELTANNIEKIRNWFAISENGNFEKNLNTIHLNPEKRKEYLTPENWPIIREAKLAIREARKERIPPATDNKGIAGWNFMLLGSIVDVIQYCRIDAIRNRASKLLDTVTKKMFESFLIQNKDRHIIKHSTTLNDEQSLFEDYVFFAETQTRLYEITANDVFLDNTKKTIDYILKSFFDGKYFFAITQNNTQLQRVPLDGFDQGHRTPIGSFIGLIRKLSSHADFKEYYDQLRPAFDYYKQIALHAPLNCGELLRVLTYPELSYKRIKVPKSWYTKPEFTQLIPFFGSRFFINYTDNSNWEVCSIAQCEHTGSDFEEFKAVFMPSEEQ